MGTEVRAGSPVAVELHARNAGERLGACSIALAERRESVVRWTIRVEALMFERAATRELGRIRTVPPAVCGIASRVVAVANCPGVRGFRVTIEAPIPEQESVLEKCDIELGYLESLGCCEGVYPIEPHAQKFGELYQYRGETLAPGANAFTLPIGARLQTFSAWQSGTGAVMVIDGASWPASPNVPIPPNGAAQMAPRGTLRDVLQTVCRVNTVPAGGGGALIEYTI